MTIALGILTKGGVVVAADTEINCGIVKSSEGKVGFVDVVRGGQKSAMAITGAGSVAYLDHIREHFMSAFGSDESPSSEEEYIR